VVSHLRGTGHARAGERILVVYEGHEKSAAGPVAEGIAGLSLWRYDLGHGMNILPRPWGQERVFDLALSGGMMGSDFWTINRKRYPETECSAGAIWAGFVSRT
jgi:hypothetical protein